jgi:hypothetical protein
MSIEPTAAIVATVGAVLAEQFAVTGGGGDGTADPTLAPSSAAPDGADRRSEPVLPASLRSPVHQSVSCLSWNGKVEPVGLA